jgi:zinc finger protein
MTFSLFSDIPHFKEVVIMATVCDYCGHKTNEVKSGGGIESKGKRISLKVTDVSDMSRDVLKVSTAASSFIEMQRVAYILHKVQAQENQSPST